MRPTLFSIGDFSVSSYYFMGLIGLIGGFFFNWLETKRKHLDVSLSVRGAIITSFAGYLGARAMHIVFDGFLEIYIQKPLAMFAFWKGGLAFYGTIIFGLPTAVWWFTSHKAPLLKYLDNYTLGIAFGVGIGRIGCYLNGCCFGKISSSPLAVQFIRYGLSAKNQFARDVLLDLKEAPFPVFPTQLLSFVANILIFLTLWGLFRKRVSKDGAIFGIWLIMYAAFRFIVEFFRADDRGLFFNNALSTSQLVAIAAFVVGLLTLILPNESQKEAAKLKNIDERVL